MNYRKFGNTGEKISALGFGCMRFPEYEKDGKMYVDQDKVDEMVAEAYRQGVNYFDTAPKYCNRNSEEAVGRAVKGFRDKVLLSTKIPLDVCKKPGDYRRALEHSLDKLGTDHLDFYHFWGINRKEFDQIIMAQDLLADADQFVQPGTQVLQIGGIDLTVFVGGFGVLVQIIAAHLQKICHPSQLRQIKMQTISIQRHLAQIGTNAQNAAGLHFVPDSFQLLLADPEVKLLVTAVIHRASPWRFLRNGWHG